MLGHHSSRSAAVGFFERLVFADELKGDQHPEYVLAIIAENIS